MTIKACKRIYADFNNCDEPGRVRLNTIGSLRDLDHVGPLKEGEMLELYDTELRVVGKAEFSRVDNIWTAQFDPEKVTSIES